MEQIEVLNRTPVKYEKPEEGGEMRTWNYKHEFCSGNKTGNDIGIETGICQLWQVELKIECVT